MKTTIREILRKYAGKYEDWEVFKSKDKDHCIVPHSDSIEGVDVDVDMELSYYQAHLMDEEEYDRTILANGGIKADFNEWYDDKDAKVLVIVYTEDYTGSADRITQLRKDTGMSQRAFAERFGIPLRTLQNWEYGVNEAPEYLINLIEDALKLDRNESKPELCELEIKYKKGTELKLHVHYAHVEDGCLYFVEYQNPTSAVRMPVRVPLENIESFEIRSR